MGSRGKTAIAVACAGVLAAVGAGAAGAGVLEIAAVAGVAIAAMVVAMISSANGSAPVAPVELRAAISELEARIAAAARSRHELKTKAETAGRFREEFVAAVRHELKTPLNAILGFTQVLLDEIDGPLTAQQREDVSAIRQAGLYLSGLVDAVLNEWAPDEQQAPLSPVDLARVVREVAKLLAGQAVAKGVAIEVAIADELPSPLGDERRVRQVLINLGTNAVRATSRGSVTLGATRDPEGVRLTVRDTGRGIAPDELPVLFEEFGQAGTAAERAGGTGLGLPLTREMVEWHGGRIEVETTQGQGTSFHVILPVEPD